MKFFLLSCFIVSNLFSTVVCPQGCLDASTKNIYTQEGKTNYDINDQKMLQAFIGIANKMKDYYSEFENESSKLIEDGAKVHYLENVISAEVILELKKGNSLKDIEIDSNSSKAQQNSQSTIK